MEVLLESGLALRKDFPECPVHGTRMRMARGVPPPQVMFCCYGFDGEGCDYTVDGAGVGWQIASTPDPFAVTIPGP